MVPWQESVYSDGTALFVSRPSPAIGETVAVRLRMYESAPVRGVRLRYRKCPSPKIGCSTSFIC